MGLQDYLWPTIRHAHVAGVSKDTAQQTSPKPRTTT